MSIVSNPQRVVKTSSPYYRPKRGQPVDIALFQLGQLRRLLRRRGQYPLDDDDRSRRLLQTLLDLGLTGPEALRIAPWISGDELQEMIDAATMCPTRWTQRSLGDRFEVTYEEKLDPWLNLRNIECFERDRGEIQEALAARRRENNRVRMAHRREKAREERTVLKLQPGTNVRPIKDFPVGHQHVYAWLDGRGWQTISDLARALKADSCTGRAPNGRKLKHKAIMWKLHRWVDDLVEGGLIGEDYIPFERGPKMRRVRRLDQVD